MSREEAAKRFRQIDGHFARHDYKTALAELDALIAHFPRSRNILYARAVALSRLGRIEDAKKQCRQLVMLFNDSRAKTRLALLEAREVHIKDWDGSTNADF